MDKKYGWTLLIAGIILIIFFIKKSEENSVCHSMYHHNQGLIFGTVYNIKYQYSSDIEEEIQQELQKVNDTFSMFNKESVISKINQNDTVVVDDYFLNVFNQAQTVAKQTNGAFDITVAPLVNFWGFGFEKKENTNQTEIDSILQFVGYEKIHLSENEKGKHISKSNPNILLDMSAIAKGFACDRIAFLFESKNIQNYLVEIGGEMRAKGINPQEKNWTVGILSPIEDSLQNDIIQQKIRLFDKSLATSGNYRNFYYKDGKKYAHTIDPKTGYPVIHNLLSASVITNECMIADAYATAFMVMGLEKATTFLEEHPELSAYFIYTDENGNEQIYYTTNFKEFIID